MSIIAPMPKLRRARAAVTISCCVIAGCALPIRPHSDATYWSMANQEYKYMECESDTAPFVRLRRSVAAWYGNGEPDTRTAHDTCDSLTIRVRDHDGRPIPNCAIAIVKMPDKSTDWTIEASGMTDDSGVVQADRSAVRFAQILIVPPEGFCTLAAPRLFDETGLVEFVVPETTEFELAVRNVSGGAAEEVDALALFDGDPDEGFLMHWDVAATSFGHATLRAIVNKKGILVVRGATSSAIPSPRYLSEMRMFHDDVPIPPIDGKPRSVVSVVVEPRR